MLRIVGEDTILTCKACGFASNEEKAPTILHKIQSFTPDSSSTCAAGVDSLQHASPLLHQILESNSIHRDSITGIILNCKSRRHLAIIPKGRKLNMIKMEKNCGLVDAIVDHGGDDAEHIHQLDSVIIDHNLVDGDKPVSPVVDKMPRLQVSDMVTAADGDICPSCFLGGKSIDTSKNTLTSQRAIEVGHTFYLGTKYSAALDCNFKTKQDKMVPMEMGCYGIGVSRLIGAVAEESRDKDGLKWPESIAPFRGCIIMALGKNSKDIDVDQVVSRVLKDHDGFTRDDLIFDDRDVSFGFKMKDALLVGYPFIFIAGKSFVETGKLEVKKR